MGFFSAALWFAVGMYAGIYIDQHYQVPNVDESKEMINKLREFLEQYKKDKPGPSKGS
ncbi:hypothetical protein NP493_441g01035 [Ridgeia piscesae]|uniref:Uncharacterized protein n=1 Tax=Ridgeia piscesae TaxID=27915 RepID=A0AAD9KZJ8_RIDPI|nr:hypothetical protein NP493_441g01035 [Ridgeia piscesae]